jgi:hypothetical protein
VLPDRPLVFLHVPKTGGTSISDAIGRLYPDDRRFTDAGAISVSFLEAIAPELRGSCFVHGHAGVGVADVLRGRAQLMTVLRRPADQAVSNYLHVIDDPQNPFHASASRRSFSDYLREDPLRIAFQAISLAVALSTETHPIDPLGRDGVAPLLDFLGDMRFVGVIERPEACGRELTRLLGADPPLRLPCLNSSTYRGVSARSIRALHAEYEALRSDAAFHRFFRLEDQVHARASALLEGPEPPGSRAGAPAHVSARRFDAPRAKIRGAALLCPLAPAGETGMTGRTLPEHIVHGPFDRFPKGCYAVTFRCRLDEPQARGRGRIEFEALADRRRCLAKRWTTPPVDRTPSTIRESARRLYFRVAADGAVLEFRVRTRGFTAGALVFEGVSVVPASLFQTLPSLAMGAVRRLGRFARRNVPPRKGPRPPKSRRVVASARPSSALMDRVQKPVQP